MSNAVTGSDSLIINQRILSDFANADAIDATRPNDAAAVETGKNGNSIFSKNENGNQMDVTIRLVRASPDDKFLNNLYAQQNNNFAGFPLMSGEYSKQVGDGTGNVQSDTYLLGGGIFIKQPGAKTSASADVDASVSVWAFRFAKSARVIG